MITEGEWASIRMLVLKLAQQVAGQRVDFITGKVIKRNEAKRLVWIHELGDQPIPIVGFKYRMKYYDTHEDGGVRRRESNMIPVVPAIGESVVIALERGSQRLPRCIGVIQGKNWLIPEVE